MTGGSLEGEEKEEKKTMDHKKIRKTERVCGELWRGVGVGGFSEGQPLTRGVGVVVDGLELG